MKVIVGLGNPGEEYANTRHNAGVVLVDLLSEKLHSDYGWRKHFDALIFKTDDVMLVKTKSIFMNESGRLLQGLDISPSDLWVAHDDLDLRLGEYKVQMGKGPKVHNGLLSIEGVLGMKEFGRVRIGIDNRVVPVDGETYVLQKFSLEERKVLDEVLGRVCNEIVETID